MDAFPAIKFFSPTDVSRGLPEPITCIRVDKPVDNSWSTWYAWLKIARYLEWPI